MCTTLRHRNVVPSADGEAFLVGTKRDFSYIAILDVNPWYTLTCLYFHLKIFAMANNFLALSNTLQSNN